MIAYVLYRGDEVLGVGTAEELAERVGVRPETIMNYASVAHRKKADRQVIAMPVPVDRKDFDILA